MKKTFTSIFLIFLILNIYGRDSISRDDKKSMDSLLKNLSGESHSGILKDIKVWDSKSSIRVVLYPDNEVKFKYNLLPGKKKDRIYIDLIGVKPGKLKLPGGDTRSFLKGIRLGRRKTGVRVVLDTGKVEKYNVMVMEEPWRIVIDYFGKIKKEPKKIVKAKQKEKIRSVKIERKKKIKKKVPQKKKEFILVIDPGHGGKDPGAVYKKIYEKDIAFKLAKIIKKKAKNRKGIKVVLTRNRDKFLPLEERAAIANNHNGDLFISLHINSFISKNAGGVEIYHLDNRRSSYTDKLAMVENRLTKKSSLLNTILVDMTMSFYIKDSLKFATGIGRDLKKTLKPYNVKLRDYRKGALFYVLVGARMPSLLLEIGFLSNPKERKLLTNKKYLNDMAASILKSVEKVKKKYKLVKAD